MIVTGATLFERGFTDLISVIPPNGTLAPRSHIRVEQRGKVPGRMNANGTWGGYDWRTHVPTLADIRAWESSGANIGLRTDRFPAVDIDCDDATLTALLIGLTRDELGAAPVRVGRAPKALLLYRTEEPFSRLRLWIRDGVSGRQHLVEVLGAGQQFVASGIHPATMESYRWTNDIDAVRADTLASITLADAERMLNAVQDAVTLMGYVCEREGSGVLAGREQDQATLLAPSLDVLADAVRVIPNDNTTAPHRADYLRMGYAIRAAAGEDTEADAFGLWLEWAMRWPGNDRCPDGNDADTVREDWRRMRPPFAVGWPYVLDMARRHGFRDADMEFPVEDEANAARPDDDEPNRPLQFSDHDLAEQAKAALGQRVRIVPAWDDAPLVWDGYRWERDETRRCEALLVPVLRQQADLALRQGGNAAEERRAAATAKGILHASTIGRVLTMLRADPALTLHPSQLDADPWLLNTPKGAVDLRTGALLPPDANRLFTRSTNAVVGDATACTRWLQFLDEVCDSEPTIQFLQRFAGYCLTGSTREHSLSFMYGSGGNGKSVFLETLAYVLGDYATQAPAETFMASKMDRHPTEVASLMGARLVTASETDAGRRWNEARLRQLTGGDTVQTRVMRSDFFRFKPQFKLLFAGNHRPVIRSVDDAMRRRLHLVPFMKRPAHPDHDLLDKLKAEASGILAWMLEGCLRWQSYGLTPPDSVLLATEDYFSAEDALGRWLAEDTVKDVQAQTVTLDAFAAWRDWCARTGEYAGTAKAFAEELEKRGYARWRDPATRRRGFLGFRLVEKDIWNANLT
jgi:putative DNA primase/helicase